LIEIAMDVPNESVLKGRQQRSEAKAIAIGLGDGRKARMEIRRRDVGCDYADARGEMCVECPAPSRWIPLAIFRRIHMSNLSDRVHTRVRATRCVDGDAGLTRPGHRAHSSLHKSLHRVLPGLDLPTGERTSVVGDSEPNTSRRPRLLRIPIRGLLRTRRHPRHHRRQNRSCRHPRQRRQRGRDLCLHR